MVDKSPLVQFTNQKYLNLETYRKSGDVVRTPVWFVEENGVLFVRTTNGSGKVKRVKNNPKVRVVPCEVYGQPVSEWVAGWAELRSTAETTRLNALFEEKYGEIKRQFESQSDMQGLIFTTIAIFLG